MNIMRVTGMAGACVVLLVPIQAAQTYSAETDRPHERNESGRYPDRIPAGTRMKVRTNDMIDVRERANNRIYTGTVEEDVAGENGTVLIPRGANAELMVTSSDRDDLSVDLEAVTVRGHRYMVAAAAYDRARHTGLGANKRTGEYVGGGAVLGSIIGAIAGGGKGAAIGALAGSGAGAGGEILTRGRAVRVPAETVLTFRLEQPLEIGRGAFSRDNGYDRDGAHYHDDYYHRDRDGDRVDPNAQNPTGRPRL
jgi:hypothetical protein